MVDWIMFPSWEDVAAAYPYAPGRGDLSNEDWKALRAQEKERRKKQLAAQEEARKNARELQKYEADWDSAMAENEEMPALITDSSQLPGRNVEAFKGAFANPLSFKAEGAAIDYLNRASEQPQNKGEFALSWLKHTGEEAGKYLAGLVGLLPEEEDKDDPKLNSWLEKYIASGGGSGDGIGGGISPELMGSPFPDLSVALDLSGYEDALKDVKAPEYQEEAFNPQMAMANMLMNADWINMDMSRAGKAMWDAFSKRAKNNADVANANAEAQSEYAKWKAAQKIALEELKANNAYKNAQLAMAKWQANQPRALGGNKMTWTDSNGNIHFQQVDKVGEARTVGTNAAMIEMMDLDGKALEKMTPKKILQRANAAAMLYPDKDKIPFIQGYILQATSMLPTKGD